MDTFQWRRSRTKSSITEESRRACGAPLHITGLTEYSAHPHELTQQSTVNVVLCRCGWALFAEHSGFTPVLMMVDNLAVP